MKRYFLIAAVVAGLFCVANVDAAVAGGKNWGGGNHFKKNWNGGHNHFHGHNKNHFHGHKFHGGHYNNYPYGYGKGFGYYGKGFSFGIYK